MRRLIVSLLFLAACTNPATQLVVTVDSDLPAAYVVAVHAVAVPGDSPGSLGVDSRFDLSGAGGPASFTLPLSFGVVPPGQDADRRVEIRVEALDTAGVPTVTRVVRTGFVSGRTLHLPIFLADACRGVTCAPELSCDRGVCVSAEVPVRDLSEVRPGDELRDAGPIPAVDAGPRDGGPSGPPVGSLNADWALMGEETAAMNDPPTLITSMCATPTGVALAGGAPEVANFAGRPISTGPRAIWIAHVASAGTVDWLRSFDTNAAIGTIDVVDDLVVITGWFSGTLAFAPGTLSAIDGQDAFVAAFELSTGATRWATTIGTSGGTDYSSGAAATDAGVLAGSYAGAPGTFHVGGAAPAALEGDAVGQAVVVVLDPANGALIRAVGLGTGNVERFALRSDGDRGALLGLASTGRVTGLHPVVPGGAGHEIALARLDASARWAWTTYLAGCTNTTSIDATRNTGAVWAAFTDSGCGALPVTLATPGGSRAGAPIDFGVPGEAIVTLGLGADGVPIASSVRAAGLHTAGARLGALTADGSDNLFVGGWLGLPSGGAMLDFGGGPTLLEAGAMGVTNGAAFVWSRSADGAFRGVDAWAGSGFGSPFVAGTSDKVTGIVVDATGLVIAGWVHGTAFVAGTRIGGGIGFETAFVVHAR